MHHKKSHKHNTIHYQRKKKGAFTPNIYKLLHDPKAAPTATI